MKKKFRIFSGVFLLLSVIILLLTTTSFKFNFKEIKIPGESELSLNKGSYSVYFINDENEAKYKNYYFELKNSQNKVIRKFPDTSAIDFIFTTNSFESGNKIYTSYSEFNIDQDDDYTLVSYSKNYNKKEIAIGKDEHVNSRIVLLFVISLLLFFISAITFITSFFLKKIKKWNY